MGNRILVLDRPQGDLEGLGAKLLESGYDVTFGHDQEAMLKALESRAPELLISIGNFSELTGSTLADKIYGAAPIPTMLVLNTAGEETQTFLRRHPLIIGVYYTPVNVEKILDRVRRFFKG